MKDQWIKSIAQGGNLSATAITATSLIEDARKRHNLGANETKALGEALMAGILLASNCKAGERISLSLKGDRFLKQTIVDANPDGTVRGFVISREAPLTPIDSTRGPWQNGLLSVVRLKKDEKEPYVGTVPNITGHLAKDLTFYLSQSEQVPSAVGLAVNLAEDGHVDSAGAFLVQALPGASKAELLMVENNIHMLESLAAQIKNNPNPTALLGQIFSDLTFLLLDERPIRFECTCSKDRIMRALKLVGKTEVEAMLEEDRGASVHCDFCGTHFEITEPELRLILRDLGANQS